LSLSEIAAGKGGGIISGISLPVATPRRAAKASGSPSLGRSPEGKAPLYARGVESRSSEDTEEEDNEEDREDEDEGMSVEELETMHVAVMHWIEHYTRGCFVTWLDVSGRFTAGCSSPLRGVSRF
jgi:hypothetical protein